MQDESHNTEPNAPPKAPLIDEPRGAVVCRVDPEIMAMIPPLSAPERDRLEASLVREGCRDPVVAWRQTGILLDGHQRREICERLGLDYAVREIDLPDREEAFAWVEEAQVARRNLSDDQRAVFAHRLQRRRTAQALGERGRALAQARWGGGCVVADVTTTHVVERIRAAVAKQARVSERRIRDVADIEKVRPHALADIANGYVSIARVRREVRIEALRAQLEDVATREAKAIEGVYDVVVIDPPWPIGTIEFYDDPENVGPPYPTMSVEDIERIDVPAATDAHVFLWTTQRFLPDALRLLSRWGFAYVCTFVWKKNGGFQPYGLPAFNCEFVLYAHKGSPKFIDTKAFSTCFEAPRRGHSAKPEEFYEMLRRVTAGRRIDMFNRRPIEGFEGWGIESPPAEPRR